MLFKLMLLFILVPLAELALLVYVGTIIGALYTVLIVVVTGVVGAVLSRSQGIATLRKIQGNLEQGVIPSEEIFNGALILVAGLLLITPGMITDVIGFALLVPYTRRAIRGWLRNTIQHKVERGEVYYWRMR
jgi:UPF0716 protein FxsA